MEQKILQWVQSHEEEIIHDVISLAKQEATASDIEALAKVRDKVVEIMNQRIQVPYEIKKTKLQKDVIYSGNDEKGILLVGHYDTVHPIGSLPIVLDNRTLYGPGVLDMKAGIVQAIWAYKCLKELGLETKYPIHMVFNGDEEVGSEASKEILLEVSKNARCALVLEPGVENGNLKTGRKGAMNCTVKVYGKAAHAGNHPEDGINSIVEMSYQIQQLQALNDNDMRTTVNVCKINGGTKTNVIADYCEITCDIRYAKVSEKERIKEAILAIPTYVEGAKKEVVFSSGSYPLEEKDENLKLYDLYVKSAEKLGLSIGHSFVGGASDGNKIAQNGVCVLDGLGAIGKGIHAVNEQVNIEVYLERIALLVALLMNIQ
ncbi:MAG: M20 family metallopeptidase [Erysipelotrichaceae bacterium]|nr:M20 family metallopeptidase [Erysipelotrichaceae bacterium]